jgi:hypothetical protein
MRAEKKSGEESRGARVRFGDLDGEEEEEDILEGTISAEKMHEFEEMEEVRVWLCPKGCLDGVLGLADY